MWQKCIRSLHKVLELGICFTGHRVYWPSFRLLVLFFYQVDIFFREVGPTHQNVKEEVRRGIIIDVGVDVYDPCPLLIARNIRTNKVKSEIPKYFPKLKGLTNLPDRVVGHFHVQTFLGERTSIASIGWAHYLLIGGHDIVLSSWIHAESDRRVRKLSSGRQRRFGLDDSSFFNEPAHELFIGPV